MARLLDVLRVELRSDRHEGRMRRGRVRRLLGADRRRAGQQLPVAAAARRRGVDHDDRRRRDGGAAARQSRRRSSRTAARSAASARRAWCWRRSSCSSGTRQPTDERRSAPGSPATCAGAPATCGSSKRSAARPCAATDAAQRLRTAQRISLLSSSAGREPGRGARTLAGERSGAWRPFAGGTDLMVLLEAGSCRTDGSSACGASRELRGIDVTDGAVSLGALTTYTDVLRHPVLPRRVSAALARRQRETGGVATQNRGTHRRQHRQRVARRRHAAGAARLRRGARAVSVRGARRVAVRRFHTGYKKMDLAPTSSSRAIHLPRRPPRLDVEPTARSARAARRRSPRCVSPRPSQLDGGSSGGRADRVRQRRADRGSRRRCRAGAARAAAEPATHFAARLRRFAPTCRRSTTSDRRARYRGFVAREPADGISPLAPGRPDPVKSSFMPTTFEVQKTEAEVARRS